MKEQKKCQKIHIITGRRYSCIGENKEDSEKHDTGSPVEAKTVSEKVRNRTEINEKLKEKVLNYLDENYTDEDLSQTQPADQSMIFLRLFLIITFSGRRAFLPNSADDIVWGSGLLCQLVRPESSATASCGHKFFSDLKFYLEK